MRQALCPVQVNERCVAINTVAPADLHNAPHLRCELGSTTYVVLDVDGESLLILLLGQTGHVGQVRLLDVGLLERCDERLRLLLLHLLLAVTVLIAAAALSRGGSCKARAKCQLCSSQNQNFNIREALAFLAAQ